MQIALTQRTQLGVVELALSKHETSILQLILQSDGDALYHWRALWEGIQSYDELDFGSKELMAAAVRKLQSSESLQGWQSVTPRDTNRLVGLPRHIWTKNRYITNQYRLISEALTKDKIEHIAIKGVGEMLCNNELSAMRTARDIDLLIKPGDWTRAKASLATLGWTPPPPKAFDLLSVIVKPHAETLVHPDGIIELDVHTSAISGLYKDSEKYTEALWERKVPSQFSNYAFVPSIIDRFIVASANAYVRFNWGSGQISKYILDAHAISQKMGKDELHTATVEGEKFLGIGSSILELLNVIERLRTPAATTEVNANSSSVISRRSSPIRISVSSKMIKGLQYLEYLTEITKLIVSGKETIRTISYLSYWGANLLFIRLPKRIYSICRQSKSATPNNNDSRNIIWYPAGYGAEIR